jgi:hypothetical protein
MSDRKLIVTHHAPDLDAISAVWLFKRFDSQHFADAKIAYVNPGDTITLEEAERDGCQLHEVTYVDTGGGEFDHHQDGVAMQKVCAASLVYMHILKIHPEAKDDLALKELVEFICNVDHFQEINWPDANSYRYVFMLHELIRGHEYIDPHNDDSQMHFGLDCIDYAYAAMKQSIKADQVIAAKGQDFEIKYGKCLAIDSRNDDTLKRAQKMGYILAVRKDTKLGNIRIKIRPDAPFDLECLQQKIQSKDHKGTWFYHGGGKMLINGSLKHKSHVASPLTLEEIVEMIKECYA